MNDRIIVGVAGDKSENYATFTTMMPPTVRVKINRKTVDLIFHYSPTIAHDVEGNCITNFDVGIELRPEFSLFECSLHPMSGDNVLRMERTSKTTQIERLRQTVDLKRFRVEPVLSSQFLGDGNVKRQYPHLLNKDLKAKHLICKREYGAQGDGMLFVPISSWSDFQDLVASNPTYQVLFDTVDGFQFNAPLGLSKLMESEFVAGEYCVQHYIPDIYAEFRVVRGGDVLHYHSRGIMNRDQEIHCVGIVGSTEPNDDDNKHLDTFKELVSDEDIIDIMDKVGMGFGSIDFYAYGDPAKPRYGIHEYSAQFGVVGYTNKEMVELCNGFAEHLAKLYYKTR